MGETIAFPWLASIGFEDDETWIHVCGASIVGEHSVLTAAHCVSNFHRSVRTTYSIDGSQQPKCCSQLALRYGENHHDTNGTWATTRKIEATDVHVHDGYKPGEAHNDVALIYTEKRIEFNETVNPICLPTHPTPGPEDIVEHLMDITGEDADPLLH